MHHTIPCMRSSQHTAKDEPRHVQIAHVGVSRVNLCRHVALLPFNFLRHVLHPWVEQIDCLILRLGSQLCGVGRSYLHGSGRLWWSLPKKFVILEISWGSFRTSTKVWKQYSFENLKKLEGEWFEHKFCQYWVFANQCFQRPGKNNLKGPRAWHSHFVRPSALQSYRFFEIRSNWTCGVLRKQPRDQFWKTLINEFFHFMYPNCFGQIIFSQTQKFINSENNLKPKKTFHRAGE